MVAKALFVRTVRWCLLAVLLVGGLSALLEHELEVHDAARLTANATFYSVLGRRIRYEFRGAGEPGPTIVFVSGFGASLEQWDAIQAALSDSAPVLAYDRAGMGFSDPADEHDAAAQAEELAGLLRAPMFTPPFVIVSYSLSSMVASVFAARHRDLVKGLVFLDPSMPEASLRHRPLKRAFPWLRASVQAFFGWARLKRFVMNAPQAADTSIRAKDSAILGSFHHWRATLADTRAAIRSSEEAVATPRFGDIPVSILSSVNPAASDDDRVIFADQKALAERSDHSSFSHLPHLDHGKLLYADNESRLVIDLIRRFEGDVRAAAARP